MRKIDVTSCHFANFNSEKNHEYSKFANDKVYYYIIFFSGEAKD